MNILEQYPVAARLVAEATVLELYAGFATLREQHREGGAPLESLARLAYGLFLPCSHMSRREAILFRIWMVGSLAAIGLASWGRAVSWRTLLVFNFICWVAVAMVWLRQRRG